MHQRVLPVTLALTTLNEEHSLPDFFSSMSLLTAMPAEVSICDGGSRDGTMALLRSWRPTEPSALRLIEMAGANIARGRNIAIAAAAHDIVAVTDAGCRLEPDWLERIVAPLIEDAGIDVVGGGYRYRAETPFERIAAAAELGVDNIPEDAFLPSSRSVAFRRSAWERVGGYPEQLTFAGEDTAFCLALRRAGYRIALRRDAIVHWRPRGSLAKYIRQHWFYGLGDGEARSNPHVYRRIVVKYFLVLAATVLGFFHAFAWIGLVGLAAAWYIRLYRTYGWSTHAASIWMPAAALITVKELCILAGFVRGTAGRGKSGA